MRYTILNIKPTNEELPNSFYSKSLNKYCIIDDNGDVELDDLDLIEGNNEDLHKPKIYNYLINNEKDFRVVTGRDFVKKPSKFEIYGETINDRGLLLYENFYIDNNLIFSIKYDYLFDTTGSIKSQKKTPIWYNNDNTITDLSKYENNIVPVFVEFSTTKKRKATYNRRSTIIMQLESKVIELLKSNANNQEEAKQMLNIGSMLLADLSSSMDKFKNSGLSSYITIELSNLKTKYTFLNNEIQPGITIINYIESFLIY